MHSSALSDQLLTVRCSSLECPGETEPHAGTKDKHLSRSGGFQLEGRSRDTPKGEADSDRDCSLP